MVNRDDLLETVERSSYARHRQPVDWVHCEAEGRRNPRIDYGGPYAAPDDLPPLHGQVDVV